MLNGHGYGMHFLKKGIIYFFDTHMHREIYIFEREIFNIYVLLNQAEIET